MRVVIWFDNENNTKAIQIQPKAMSWAVPKAFTKIEDGQEKSPWWEIGIVKILVHSMARVLRRTRRG